MLRQLKVTGGSARTTARRDCWLKGLTGGTSDTVATMSRRSQAAGGTAGNAGAADEPGRAGEQVDFTKMILGERPSALACGRKFSQANSLRFYKAYEEYKRSLELCNSGQSITRPLLQLTQLLRKSIRSCLSRTYFDGSDLEEDDLLEALAKHAECWEGDRMDPAVALAAVTRLVTMGSEPTALERVDGVMGELEV